MTNVSEMKVYFRWKKVSGFFVTRRGGGSEKVWHLSQKNVFLRLPLCRVIYLVLWECFLEFVQDDTFPQHEYCIALLRRWVSGIDCRFYTRFDCSWSDIKMMLCGSDVHPTWITSIVVRISTLFPACGMRCLGEWHGDTGIATQLVSWRYRGQVIGFTRVKV